MIDTGILESGFPHSSRAGYDRGCKGKACPGKADNGLSCADAVMREAGDYGFRKLIRQGKTAIEAAAIIDAAPVKADPRPKVKKAPKLREQRSQASVAVVPERAAVNHRFRPLVHGTTAGYKRGCRRDEDCPAHAVGNPSCRTVMAEYQLEYRMNHGQQKRPAASA